jgi:glycosyltransferase involved in cell wall biosynthesis
VIVDDCPEDLETPKVVAKFQKDNPRIRFIKNKTNIGFSKNFLKTLTSSSGKYIFTIGDDDVLIDPDALKKYVDVFEKNPKVEFIYSNILQFNADYEMDYVYVNFPQNQKFNPQQALKSIWLNSCFIGGIGLRNRPDFAELYPKVDKLFPQVELMGKILAKGSAYGLNNYSVAARAHSDQLGFAAMKGKRIKKDEKDSSVELVTIYTELKDYYKKYGYNLDSDGSFIKQHFITNDATALPTEKINTGNQFMIQKFLRGIKYNKMMLTNPKYLAFFLLSLATPRPVLFQLKEGYKKRLVQKHWLKEQKFFNQKIGEILKIRTKYEKRGS